MGRPMITVFCVSCVLILLAVMGVVDAAMPDDDFWNQFKRWED